MGRPKRVTISKKVQRAARRQGGSVNDRGRIVGSETEHKPKDNTSLPVEKIGVEIPDVIPVRKLAEVLNQTATSVVSKLFANGVQASINESVDFDTAAIIADEFNYEAKRVSLKEESDKVDDEFAQVKKIPRSPVITVMGHVDHGKTKLLDMIRQTNVVDMESGGITQHIGAYQVPVEIKQDKKTEKRLLTFLDTPGHEAFSTMRAHGANITDIVVLVVAADDGVKPQTIEAISHARAANVPIIVAINKIDKPDADQDKVKRELAEQNLIPEEWGGQTPMIPVSAKTGENVSTLLEIIALTADMATLTSHQGIPGRGVVIESKIKSGLGPVATILVQDGTIQTSDIMVVGNSLSKIRTMEDDRGRRVKEASASCPVQVSGFKTLPKVGDRMHVYATEKEAHEKLNADLKKNNAKSAISTGLGEASRAIKQGEAKELNLILKADTQGSLEAIKNSLEDIQSDEVRVNFIHSGIGEVSESDIQLASSSQAVILAFRVATPPAVKRLADSQKCTVSRYDIIYELIDDIKATLEGLLEPEIVETEVGRLKVIKQFRSIPNGGIVGGLVTKGMMRNGVKFRVKRNDELIGEGVINEIHIGPNPTPEAEVNSECGLNFTGNIKFKPDDIIEAYQTEEIIKRLK